MKRIVLLLICVCSIGFAQSQSGSETVVKQRVELLNSTVFGTKDSATLDGLLASQLSYGHSGGKVEDRAQTLHNAGNGNANTYANTSMEGFSVFFSNKKTAVVRYLFFGDQTNKDGLTKLKFNMLQVWVKEGKQWKLAARQAVKLP